MKMFIASNFILPAKCSGAFYGITFIQPISVGIFTTGVAAKKSLKNCNIDHYCEAAKNLLKITI